MCGGSERELDWPKRITTAKTVLLRDSEYKKANVRLLLLEKSTKKRR